MGAHSPHLSPNARSFVISRWDTDVRLTSSSAAARSDLRLLGIEGEIRRFLLDATLRGSVSPEAWSELVNAQTYTAKDVKRDATEFWMWLYDGAPLPKEGGVSDAMGPPQV